jgi:AraC-like DNA-binding protein
MVGEESADPTVTSEWTRALVAWAHGRGLAIGPMLTECGIDAHALAVPGSRVPFRSHRALWVLVAQATADPTFGLDVVDRFVDAGAMGLLGLLAETCETLGDALDTVCRLNALANQASLMRIWVEQDCAFILDAHTRDGTPYPRAMAEAVLTFYCMMMKQTCPGHDVVREVWFCHSAPPDDKRYAAKLGAPVRFSQPHNVLVLDRAALALPMVTARPTLRAHLQRQATSLLEALPVHDDIESRVRAAIRLGAVSAESSSVDALAQTLGVSRRTLQRRVADAGHSVVSLVEEEKKERARILVTTTSLELGEIAARLGFSDVRAFRRAFKRWFDVAPNALRGADWHRSKRHPEP